MQAVAALLLAVSMSQPAAPAATGGLAGRVTVDGTSTPIAGARVLVFPAGPVAGPMGPPPQATTDQDGRFAFDGLPAGEYRIDVQKAGFAPLSEPDRGPAPPVGRVPRGTQDAPIPSIGALLSAAGMSRAVTIAAGQVASVDLRLQRGGVISGRVLDPTGEPWTDARVMAMRRMPAPATAAAVPQFMPAPMQGPQQTNDLGEFRIPGLAPGEYVVAAVPHAFSGLGGPGVTPPSSTGGTHTTAVTTFYPGTADQAAAQRITVAAGAEVGNIVFMVQSAPAFRVSGVVVDESGAPIEDAIVMLMNDRRGGAAIGIGPGGSGRSDARGRFVIEDVPAGTYRANASVMMRWTSSGSGGIGAVSSGFVREFSSRPSGRVEPPPEIVVTDSDVGDVRIVTQRPRLQQ
jgi:Carboxypeptidase regulatory-like domain